MSVYSLLNKNLTDTVIEFAQPKSKSLDVEKDMVMAILTSVEKIRGKLVQSFIDNGFNLDKVNFSMLSREIKGKLYLCWYNGFATGLDEGGSDISFSTGNELAEFANDDDPLEIMKRRIFTVNQIIKRANDPSTSNEQKLIDKEKIPKLIEKTNQAKKQFFSTGNKTLNRDDRDTLTTLFQDFDAKVNVFDGLRSEISPSRILTKTETKPRKTSNNKIKTPLDDEYRKLKATLKDGDIEGEKNLKELELERSKLINQIKGEKVLSKLQSQTPYEGKTKRKTLDALNRTLATNKYASEASVEDGINFLTQSDFGRVYLENRLNYISKMYEGYEKDLITKRLTEYVITDKPNKSKIISNVGDNVSSVIQTYFEEKKSSYYPANNPDKKPLVSQVRNLENSPIPVSGKERKLYDEVENAMYPDIDKLKKRAKELLATFPDDATEIPVEKNDAMLFGYTQKTMFSRDLLRSLVNIKSTDYFAPKIGRVMATEVQAAHHLGRLTKYYNDKVDLVRWVPNARSKSGICKRCQINALKNSEYLPTVKFGLSGIYFLAETLNNPELAIPRHPYCLCLFRPLTDKERTQVFAAGYVEPSSATWSTLMGGVASANLEEFMNAEGRSEEDKKWWTVNNFVKGTAIGAGVLATGLMMYYFMKSLTGKQIKQVLDKAVEKEILTDTQVNKGMYIKNVVEDKLGKPLQTLTHQQHVDAVEQLVEKIPIDIRPKVNIEQPHHVEDIFTDKQVDLTVDILEIHKNAVNLEISPVKNSVEKKSAISQLDEAIEHLRKQSEIKTIPTPIKTYAKGVEKQILDIRANIDKLEVEEITPDDLTQSYNNILESVNFDDEPDLDKLLRKLQDLNAEMYGENFNKRIYNNKLQQAKNVAKNIRNIETQFENILPTDLKDTLHPTNYIENVFENIDNVDENFKLNFEKYKQITSEFDTLKTKLALARTNNRYQFKTVKTPDIIGGANITKVGAISKSYDVMTNLINKEYDKISPEIFEQLADKYKDKIYEIKTTKTQLNPTNIKVIRNAALKFKNDPSTLSQQDRTILQQLVQLHIDQLNLAEFRLFNILDNIAQKQNRVLVVDFGKKHYKR